MSTMKATLVAGSVLALLSCGAGATGEVRIGLEAEDTITRGLASGSAEEDVIDGWTVTYTRFVVTLGGVRLARSSAGEVRTSDALTTVDLRALPASGFELASFAGVAATRWDVFGFETPSTSLASTRDASVSAADFGRMVAGACTYLLVGTLTSDLGQTLDFDLCVPAATEYGPCSTPDGMSGVAVAAAATSAAHVTLHGDHLWFNAFPSGAEAIVERRAQWMLDCDADGDRHVTEAELQAMPAASIFTTLRHYDLAGGPTVDGHGILTAWDWVRAQMSTLGHFQGEGECAWSPSPSGI